MWNQQRLEEGQVSGGQLGIAAQAWTVIQLAVAKGDVDKSLLALMVGVLFFVCFWMVGFAIGYSFPATKRWQRQIGFLLVLAGAIALAVISDVSSGRAVAPAALATQVGIPGASSQQVVQGRNFGYWAGRCEVQLGTLQEHCGLVQSVTTADKPNLNVAVVVLRSSDRRSHLLRVLAPLGVLLPAGAGLTVDASDKGRVQFDRCMSSGCVAEIPVDDLLMRSLLSSSSASIVLFETPDQGAAIPFSLHGLKEGLVHL